MARSIQEKRFAPKGMTSKDIIPGIVDRKYFNSEMNATDIESDAEMEIEAREYLTFSAEKLSLSGRGFHRVIKVARTIADLEGNKTIAKRHVSEALQYRHPSF